MDQELLSRVERWIAGDPDAVDRAELQAALAAEDWPLLEARFAGRLSFGTAGLRGVIGAGPAAINRAVIRQTTHGLADVLDAQTATAGGAVVIGFDARRRSQALAHEACGALRARGYAVYLWDQPTPTPATPFWLHRLGAAAGIQVTASHNPPQDNGFKVYWDHGAQITPPIDGHIARAIEGHAEGPATGLSVLPADAAGPPLKALSDEALHDYWQAVRAQTPATSPAHQPYSLVYSAMHGVGGSSVCHVLEAAGFSVHPVPEQFDPDGEFPTVAFPNPEEEGAMDLAVALAEQVGADLILANDPDADRLAVAVPDGGSFRLLNGNEIGVLLGDHCMRHAAHDTGLVASSVVSSEALGALAKHHGYAWAQALTGFKWIMTEARRRPDLPFLFGYEEALGYCVGATVADKDGISAALAFAHMARALKAEGRDVLARLADIHATIGAYVSSQWVQRFEGVNAPEAMAQSVARARHHAPERLHDLTLAERHDYADGAPWDASLVADMVALSYTSDTANLRILVRPSGTEPKVKTYFEYRCPHGVESAKEGVQRAQAAWMQVLGVS